MIIPSAVDGDGVLMLMNSTYPAISIEDDFVTFTAGALESLTSSGSAQVDENAISGVLSFEQEVEAALQLQDEIPYPVTDDKAANLVLFLPFEEVPGSKSFVNIVNTFETYTCSGDTCPTAGLRGHIDRGAFFDGLDDHLILEKKDSSPLDDMGTTIAVWVKADRGTIVDTRDVDSGRDGIELDFLPR